MYKIKKRRVFSCAAPLEIPLPKDVVTPEDERVRACFAPDPVTGWPASDIQILMSDKQRPEVKEFVREYLMRENTPSSPTDETTAFALCKSRYEDRQEYIARLREFTRQEVSKITVSTKDTQQDKQE